jgi:hypothetical protein
MLRQISYTIMQPLSMMRYLLHMPCLPSIRTRLALHVTSLNSWTAHLTRSKDGLSTTFAVINTILQVYITPQTSTIYPIVHLFLLKLRWWSSVQSPSCTTRTMGRVPHDRMMHMMHMTWAQVLPYRLLPLHCSCRGRHARKGQLPPRAWCCNLSGAVVALQHRRHACLPQSMPP